MKKLILVRHGKSSWENPLQDLERPLKKRGHKDGKIIAEEFKPYLEKPIKIFSSEALRAKTTAHIFKTILGIKDDDFTIEPTIYTFDKKGIISFLRKQDDSIDQIMLFGHNPAFTALANELGDKTLTNLPTTGLIVIKFETDTWGNITEGETLLTLFPKDFK